MRYHFFLSFVAVVSLVAPARAEDTADVPEGHSFHGEEFNEGPRQSAELIDGLPAIDFPTSASEPKAQAFFEQGVAQLHGFWYLEAERSFRQAAAIEPEYAMAYWGMAMANTNNRSRAQGLIDRAMELREENADDRERRYIEMLDRYLGPSQGDDDQGKKKNDDKQSNQKRAKRFVSDLEDLLHEYPDDIEAKAFLAVHLWMFERKGVEMPSRYAVDALLGDVFNRQPMHPAHHYRIHLWDRSRPKNALESAAKCGPSSPAIAHMWHMPGHIYSRLHRYNDAAWQQEASARVDHAHMSRARLLPDQIHNYAHNNEWLTRNLIHVGRVNDALEQAHNLISLPRHPSYNSMDKRGSYRYGHERLLQVLTTFELWDQLIAQVDGAALVNTGNEEADLQRTGWLAVACFLSDDRGRGGKILRQLQRERLDLLEQKQAALETNENEKAKQRNVKEIDRKLSRLKPIIFRASAASAVARNDAEAFQRLAPDARLDSLTRARWLGRVGKLAEATEIAEKQVKESPGEVLPLATLVDLLWQQEQNELVLDRFAELQTVAANADIETPLLAKLAPIAKEAGANEDWRKVVEPADDLGQRPLLDKLGPFRWQSYQAPSWQASTADGEVVADATLPSQPRIVIFYLGFGCLHCVEQLHAFSPKIEAYNEAGIDLVAISTESTEQLQLGIKNFEEELSIPLLADPDKKVFKSYRCWDDFESQPLHGTFLIDAQGKVLWQDISHEPFTDADFLLKEAKRLLALQDS